MTPQLVIFDCDGVLVETESHTERAMADYFTAHGLTISPCEIAALFQGGTMEGAGEEAIAMGAILPPNWLEEIYAAVFASLSSGVQVFDGLFDLLDALDANHIAIAVASNGPMAKMKISLGPSGLWDRLLPAIYSREHYAPKPAPDMLLAACRAAGVSPRDAVMIDDTTAGTRAADAAGMPAIGFAAASDAEKLRATGHPVAVTMSEIQTKLGL